MRTTSKNPPFVSIVTPVYNGETYLDQCIESVMSQTYQNWEYLIVNNCSTDGTRKIAQRYAMMDARIRVYNCEEFVGVIENHNRALRLISADSDYCKVVSADDWIYPECIEKMVEVAELYPTVVIVGSYQRRGDEIRWTGIPGDLQYISGMEMCRASILDNLDVFGDPTSVLYRSNMIIKNDSFYPHSMPHADTSACYKYLQHGDFGFVHEVLSTERVHENQVSSSVKKMGMDNFAFMHTIIEYGQYYLTANEYEKKKDEVLQGYYRWLGGCVLKMRRKEFWCLHTSRLKELGYSMSWLRIIKYSIFEILKEIHNPRVAYKKLQYAIKYRDTN